MAKKTTGQRKAEVIQVKTVQIDGDWFRLAFPTVNAVNGIKPRMAEDENDIESIELFLAEQFCVLDLERSLLYRSFDNWANAFRIGKNGAVRSKRFNQVRLRPVLIPLSGELEDTAAIENPNGSIVEGGSLFLNGRPVTHEDGAIDLSACEIGDTVGEPLRWMWWNGRLYYAGMPYLVQAPDAVKWIGYLGYGWQ